VAHAPEDVADPQVALWHVCFVQHPVLAAAAQVIRMNHDGNAASGSSSASLPLGSGSVP
jgi:hypothetical protein